MRQRQWMELFSEYGCETKYLTGKADEVVDAWSRKGGVEMGEGSLIGPKLVLKTTDKVALIKENLKAATDRQKSYEDKRHKLLKFKVGDRVLLKVSPWKGEVRFRKKDEIKVDKTLCFMEETVEIMEREIKKLKCKITALVKVRWNSKHGPEFSWEHEDQMRIKYPQLFVDKVVEPAS
nr:hypothetical protein [Tanacetum cinerariifolium]